MVTVSFLPSWCVVFIGERGGIDLYLFTNMHVSFPSPNSQHHDDDSIEVTHCILLTRGTRLIPHCVLQI